MIEALKTRLAQLSQIQRDAVNWQEGAALVLAGPGAGKTGVLTARIARILAESSERKFKVLALTFTTKAAKEMGDRVAALVPDAIERTFIGTIHAFCAAVLRQHGSHIGIKPDFGIYDQDVDRQAVLRDGLQAAKLTGDPANLLGTIDRLKQNLIIPEKTADRFSDPAVGTRIAQAFKAYEDQMRAENLMDFNGLILETFRLIVKAPAVAERLRQTYPYWLLDEFQDTSTAQYRMLRGWAGDTFKNVFAVADDDQIIYQWNGASYRQLEKFRADFLPTQIQLVENHRCPASIVAAANLLVAHNTLRTPNKSPLIATRADGTNPIQSVDFADDATEAEGVAALIAQQAFPSLKNTAVIARTRAHLQLINTALQKNGIKAVLAERRGRFVSPQFVWLQAALDLAVRPTDKRIFATLGGAAERLSASSPSTENVLDEANAGGIGLLDAWAARAKTSEVAVVATMGEFADGLVNARAKWRAGLSNVVQALREAAAVEGVVPPDIEEDTAAWRAAEAEIKREKGEDPDLPEFIQGLALRSKSPPQDPDAVSLLTVHASKGLEFDHVYVVALAESEFPSYQSVQKGPTSPEMEEERRNCFVAVTRTKQTLILSRAAKYRSWQRSPSRFLKEMGY